MEYKIEGDQQLSTMEYLEKIRSYLCDVINDLKKSGKWKIHETMKMWRSEAARNRNS